jgi:hypothetical protein
VAEGRQRNRGFFSDLVRGESNACEASKNLSFLFRSRVVRSSLLHLRCSGKVNSSNFACMEFSDVHLHGHEKGCSNTKELNNV